MISLSSGARNNALHTLDLRAIFNRGCAKLKVYGGTAPSPTAAQIAAGYTAADLAETGTLLCTITGSGASVKAAQKIRFTPTPGTANGGVWGITLNGTLVTFTDDGTPTAAEICTGLYNAWRVASGAIAVTTPACTINNPDVYQKFTFTDNTGTLDIEATVAGTAFDYSASISGAGAGTGAWATSVITADAYGLQFEPVADISQGIIEKLSTQEWKGTVATAGTATHYRLILDADDGQLTTTQKRVQGTVNTANGDLNFASGTNFVVGDFKFVNTYSLTWPGTES
ncbi:MAG: hypothetical protein C4586_08280 [Anaerolineaceae bacterium]|nr:MAG: hypothetical protein C4586_08280 [Anaerolineaceae bacterium]